MYGSVRTSQNVINVLCHGQNIAQTRIYHTLITLVNSQKGSDTRVCVSTYFDTADSKSGNRLALSDPVCYRRHYVVGFSSHF